MKVRFEGKTDAPSLTHGKVYEVLEVDPHGYYRIVVDFGEDYLIPRKLFSVVEE